jgi:hypothetical protein
MRKQKDTPFPAHEFDDRLDAIIAAANRAGMSMTKIAAELEQRAKICRGNAAVNVNLSTEPQMFDPWGRPR